MAHGTDHDGILTNDECYALVEKSWLPMHEQKVHVHARGWHSVEDGPTEAIVIVARGEAARMLERFVDEEVPPFSEPA